MTNGAYLIYSVPELFPSFWIDGTAEDAATQVSLSLRILMHNFQYSAIGQFIGATLRQKTGEMRLPGSEKTMEMFQHSIVSGFVRQSSGWKSIVHCGAQAQKLLRIENGNLITESVNALERRP